MFNRDEVKLMVHAARLYYENDLTQEMIASRMNLTRQKVSRLLIEARAQGIVRIKIYDPFTTDQGLAENLKTLFGLREVILIAGEGLENDQIRSGIGLAAAQYLQNIFQDGQRVGIGWGRTLFAAISSLNSPLHKQIQVVPLIGGIGNLPPFFQVNDLARRLAESFGGTYHSLYAPAFIEDQAVLNSLMRTDEITRTIELWKCLDIAVVGVGHVEFQQISSMFFAEHISPPMLADLEANGVVGDICARFFDGAGRHISSGTGVIGMNLEQLKAVPEVIAIAGGMEKVRAIYGALQGGYIKTLVTDTVTASAILAAVRDLVIDSKGGVQGDQ
ncbi:MAG TPA: sugar-binding transcriptional regulator [Anaerolineaceae bacterium]|nr:sugar-binding transcriptional regulator [Anaerolineaceae bacterium]